MALIHRALFTGEIVISTSISLFDFPHKTCINCDKSTLHSRAFCTSCLEKIRPLMRPRHQLGWELPNALRVRSISYYSGPIARYIQIAKSQPFGYLPKFLFQPIHEVLNYWSEELRDLKFDAITHVPGNTLRCFVETDLSFAIAEKLAFELKKPHVNLLFRPLSLRQQKALSAEKRWSSRKRDFLANKKNCKAYKGRKILLVDDVCTSGSSLFFASQSLIQEGLHCEDALVLSCSPSFSRIQCLFESQSSPMIYNHYGRGI